ncbi:hypothetical protein DFH08DRAFT_818312 [Mycena albidolilacea]|uniref:Uncharacterized protein n=1 Tax=Mycena albidolilacea TaxID=1033008 RepID=A0AAD6ZH59_9AGAR|nr:hypothetical protein DFH08DRAFT_818312 [Mycena albidolilacea]
MSAHVNQRRHSIEDIILQKYCKSATVLGFAVVLDASAKSAPNIEWPLLLGFQGVHKKSRSVVRWRKQWQQAVATSVEDSDEQLPPTVNDSLGTKSLAPKSITAFRVDGYLLKYWTIHNTIVMWLLPFSIPLLLGVFGGVDL